MDDLPATPQRGPDPGPGTARLLPLPAPLLIAEQGSFAFGGLPPAESARGGHGYVQYQIPVAPRPHPLVMWHGGTTSGSCWEGTPDGREGFASILLRMGFSCYLIDHPGKGRGGVSSASDRPSSQAPPTDPSNFVPDHESFTVWRLGVWDPPDGPVLFPGIQIPTNDWSVDQILRRRTPSSGPAQTGNILNAMSSLLADLGPSIVVVHSNSGQYAWQAVDHNVAGIVAYEPAAFVFPESDLPPDVDCEVAALANFTRPIPIPDDQFDRLTRIPIQIVYGDNISDLPSSIVGVELWRVNLLRARQFQAAVNGRGGDVTVLHLPELGVHGNTHFPFADLNNNEIAALMERFLVANQLA